STPTTGVGANMSDKIDKFIESTESKLSKFEDIIENNKMELVDVKKTVEDAKFKSNLADKIKALSEEVIQLKDEVYTKHEKDADNLLDNSYLERRLHEVVNESEANLLPIINELNTLKLDVNYIKLELNNQADVLVSGLNRLSILLPGGGI
ncbi:MAG: hypothetical protein DRH15_04185, partial [Deltaproteobacteria bacterium]